MSNHSRKVICPGSFDPVTLGHLDIIERSAELFDEVIVAVLSNPTKDPVFDVETRMRLLSECCAQLPNVRVDSFSGLLVDYCRAQDVHALVKGLRAVSDFEYELQMAQMNNELGDVETLFMSTDPEYAFVSSSLIKQVARYGGDVSKFVPPNVASALADTVEAR